MTSWALLMSVPMMTAAMTAMAKKAPRMDHPPRKLIRRFSPLRSSAGAAGGFWAAGAALVRFSSGSCFGIRRKKFLRGSSPLSFRAPVPL